MTVSLHDLMPSQLRLLAKLCGDAEPEDAIGCELSELSDDEVLTAQPMVMFGLVEIVEGWRGTGWPMLTGLAQRLLEGGFPE